MMRVLLAAFWLTTFPLWATAAGPPAPTTLVVISCMTHVSGPPDQNGIVPRDWDYKDAKIHCRREEVPLQDMAEYEGAKAIGHDFSDHTQCAKVGAIIAPNYDGKHGPWYLLAVGCPTRIVNQLPDGSEETVGWQLPPCPSWVFCEVDTSI